MDIYEQRKWNAILSTPSVKEGINKRVEAKQVELETLRSVKEAIGNSKSSNKKSNVIEKGLTSRVTNKPILKSNKVTYKIPDTPTAVYINRFFKKEFTNEKKKLFR